MDTIWFIVLVGLSQIWKVWWFFRWVRRYFSWTHCGRCGEKTSPTFAKAPNGDFFCTTCDPEIWAAYLEKDNDPLKPEDESDKLNLDSLPIGSKERMAKEFPSLWSGTPHNNNPNAYR